ncbi:YhgE/Pip domain-containing protein [Bifidobacterium phasiani]|uniref:YhgE/Pip domain-containing protein n=1 Tax=Bifidobacterium phasiani TaxID=2834431 RepID=A0ABS6W7V4_9BIFI|nr:YhgE/Pip domain-containing protein [Bifidobacterium phasiani]MBW3082579.1 YhgE/Pip domain-containing protein [Bifidobacterium phasiani]
MRAVWHLFADDVRRLAGNATAMLVVAGLVAIPSLFAWFNIAASWDPFGNLGDLKVAVADTDEGYRSDLIPVKVTIGAQVVDKLRANDQLDWTFTTERDAIEGTESGAYYAAIVIPEDFSATMMTFFTGRARQASIAYYSNEKKNAVAPNLTGAGADAVAAQINETFVATLTDIALDIASSLADQLERPETQSALAAFDANVADFATRLGDTAGTLDGYRALTDTARSLLDNSAALLGQTSTAVGQAAPQLDTARQGVDDVASALDGAVATVQGALGSSADAIAQVGDDVDTLFGDASDDAASTTAAIRRQADALTAQAAVYRQLRQTVQGLPGAQGDAHATAVADALQRTADQLDALSAGLGDAADALDTNAADAETQRQAVQELIDQAKSSASDAADSFGTSLGTQTDRLAAAVRDASSVLSQDQGRLASTVTTLGDAADSAGRSVDDVRATLEDAASALRTAGERLAAFHASLASALDGADSDAVRAVLGTDASTLSAALAAPIALHRQAVFPVGNFGSAMAPYYTFIPLWTASILIMLAVSVEVSPRQRRGIGEPGMTPRRMFLGRFGVVALISLMQSTVSCLGSLLILHVQAVHPLLFMLSGWVGGLVFALFVYTMVACFGNIGKAVGMLMLVVQVSGSAGSYPLQTLPEFMQRISPFLPITHAIRAMRAAIAGIYMNDYWIELGKLVVFVPPLLLLGLLLRQPMAGLNRWLGAQLERTRLIG